MVGPKSTQTRVVGILLTDEMHPYTFHRSLLLEIGCRDVRISSVSIILLLLFVYFLALYTIPTYFFN